MHRRGLVLQETHWKDNLGRGSSFTIAVRKGSYPGSEESSELGREEVPCRKSRDLGL